MLSQGACQHLKWLFFSYLLARLEVVKLTKIGIHDKIWQKRGILEDMTADLGHSLPSFRGVRTAGTGGGVCEGLSADSTRGLTYRRRGEAGQEAFNCEGKNAILWGMEIQRLKRKALANLITRFPWLARVFIHSYTPEELSEIPWSPPVKKLGESKVALVTTAGVHHTWQTPFDMKDPMGDPTFRELKTNDPERELMITHDYYDHADADRDINVVFPVDRLEEFRNEGLIGELSDIHYSFMGHIEGPHLATLRGETGPEVARRLRQQGVDVVLLTPG
jgi:D-proline reductase (dithiol) PrdB